MISERRIVDAVTRRALLLLRVAGGIAAWADAELRRLAHDLRALIAGVDWSTLGRRDMAALLRDVEAAITARYAAIGERVADDLSELGDDEERWAARVLGVRDHRVGAAAALLVLGYPLASLWLRQARNTTDRVSAVIRMAQSGTMPADQVLGAIIGTGPRGRERGGVLESDRSQAASIIATATRSAAMAAQRRAWSAAGVEYLRWHSILDSRTTIGCAVRAGAIYTVGGEPVGHGVPMGIQPPAHWNCRSLLAPMAPGFEPPGDGRDPYVESLDDWLRRHDERMQDEMLGPVRAGLWRAGKITTRDLLGRNGETLTVAELAGMHGD